MRYLSFVLVCLLMGLSACTPSTPAPILQAGSSTATVAESTVASAETAALPAENSSPTDAPTDVPATQTPLPTSTPLPTATAIPTATAVPPLALADQGMDAWCIPQKVDVAVSRAANPWQKPDEGRSIQTDGDQVNLLAPSWSCVFTFTFNQAAPVDLKLQIFETRTNTDVAWYDQPLVVADGQPNLVYIVVRHSYIVDPPAWQLPFRFRLAGADGTEYWSQVINIKRDCNPRVCWNGTIQNAVTLMCPVPSWGDRHPTDWGYNLPMPTPGGEPGSGSFMNP